MSKAWLWCCLAGRPFPLVKKSKWEVKSGSPSCLRTAELQLLTLALVQVTLARVYNHEVKLRRERRLAEAAQAGDDT